MLASLTAAALVTGTATTAAIGSSAQAAPAADCKAPYPVASLAGGQPVTGKTVSSGVTPAPFTGEVIGVLDDGIAPGLDMVIVDLDSPAISAAGGIWQGMSGSPVYAGDGRLIGAVAYGLASAVADRRGHARSRTWTTTSQRRGRPGRTSTGTRRSRSPPRRTSPQTRPEQGFKPLGIATGVSGVGASRLSKLTPAKRAYFPNSPVTPPGGPRRTRRRRTTSSQAATSPRRTPPATSPSAVSGRRRRSATTRSWASATRWTSSARRP